MLVAQTRTTFDEEICLLEKSRNKTANNISQDLCIRRENGKSIY